MGSLMMKNQLRVKLTKKPHAYPEVPEATIEAWGEIQLIVIRNTQVIPLFSTEWDLALFAEWIIANWEAIHKGELTTISGEFPRPSESLSETLSRFYEHDFSILDNETEEKWFDVLDEYVRSHNLWYGLLGAKIPSIIIGHNHDSGEISLYTDDIKWAYQFDTEDFKMNLKAEIRDFIKSWQMTDITGAAQERAFNILIELDQL